VLFEAIIHRLLGEGCERSASAGEAAVALSSPLNLRVAGFKLQMEQFEGILGAPLRT